MSRILIASFAAVGLSGLLVPGPARGQAVGFQPVVGAVPDGVMMGVVPAVSADRRYVRLGVNPGFYTVNRFDTATVTGAVGGGGAGGFPIGGLPAPADSAASESARGSGVGPPRSSATPIRGAASATAGCPIAHMLRAAAR